MGRSRSRRTEASSTTRLGLKVRDATSMRGTPDRNKAKESLPGQPSGVGLPRESDGFGRNSTRAVAMRAAYTKSRPVCSPAGSWVSCTLPPS